MKYDGPLLLSTGHVLDDFDCGKPALNIWLVRRALGNQASGTRRTWVVTEAGSTRVVAFYTSSTASIIRSSAPKAFGRIQPEELPAILLGRMAVDISHAGQGLGGALLKHFMTKAVEVAAAVGVHVPSLSTPRTKEPRRGFTSTTAPPSRRSIR